MPYRKLFLSRWSALLWAAGIIVTAVDTVGFAPSHPFPGNDAAPALIDATGATVNDADLANFARIANAF
jgi:hypothetical protein